MKIIFIATQYEYSDKSRGLSYAYSNFYDTLVKMNGRQNQVLFFPVDEVIKELGREEANKRLLDMVFREKPDICFFCLSKDEVKQETIKKITKESASVTLNWFTDDHWRFYNFSRHWAPCFDWVITTDPKAVVKYRNIGYNNVIMSQWACNHFLYKPLRLPKIHDVTFVGQPHGNRKRIIEEVRGTGINIECWGWGWPNGQISFDRMLEVFSQSKINICLTNSSTSGILKSIVSIFLVRNYNKKIRLASPASWFDNVRFILAKRRSQFKGRNCEVPGCGSFLLTQDADGLKECYVDGKEVVIFKDAKDLVVKIKYYLEHEEDRELIAKAGYERTMRDHTYEKRFNEIFTKINAEKKK